MTTVAVRFRLEPETLDLVDEHAKRERRSRAKLVRMIVEDWIMDKAAKHTSHERITKIPADEITEMTINEDGDKMYADLIIENRHGRWYGVSLGGDDWDYLSDNGEYVPVPSDPRRQTTDEFAARAPAGSMLVDTRADYRIGPSTPADTPIVEGE